jgi:hypothetical protein
VGQAEESHLHAVDVLDQRRGDPGAERMPRWNLQVRAEDGYAPAPGPGSREYARQKVRSELKVTVAEDERVEPNRFEQRQLRNPEVLVEE